MECRVWKLVLVPQPPQHGCVSEIQLKGIHSLPGLPGAGGGGVPPKAVMQRGGVWGKPRAPLALAPPFAS